MDLDEQLQNAQTFMEIVQNQRDARQRLIYLLIWSRCRFGANEAAEAFMKLDDQDKGISQQLRDRKRTLLDAMELEGLDFEEIKKADDNKKKDKTKRKEQELPPLTWYNSGNNNEKKGSNNDSVVDGAKNEDEPNAKRVKVGYA